MQTISSALVKVDPFSCYATSVQKEKDKLLFCGLKNLLISHCRSFKVEKHQQLQMNRLPNWSVFLWSGWLNDLIVGWTLGFYKGLCCCLAT